MVCCLGFCFFLWFICLPPRQPLSDELIEHDKLNFIGIYENEVVISLTNFWRKKIANRSNNKALN